MPVLSAPVFCCSQVDIRMPIRTLSQIQLWRFAWDLTNFGPPGPSATDSPGASLTPAHLVAPILSDSRFAIQVEKRDEGHKVEERFFIRHPLNVHAWLELEKYQVWRDFMRDWEHIKFGCQHRHTHYVLKMLEKYDESAEAFRARRIDNNVMYAGRSAEDLGNEEVDWEEVAQRNRVGKREKRIGGNISNHHQEGFQNIC